MVRPVSIRSFIKVAYLSEDLSADFSGVLSMERSGDRERGLREALNGEELRKDDNERPCRRISCTARSLWNRAVNNITEVQLQCFIAYSRWLQLQLMPFPLTKPIRLHCFPKK